MTVSARMAIPSTHEMVEPSVTVIYLLNTAMDWHVYSSSCLLCLSSAHHQQCNVTVRYRAVVSSFTCGWIVRSKKVVSLSRTRTLKLSQSYWSTSTTCREMIHSVSAILWRKLYSHWSAFDIFFLHCMPPLWCILYFLYILIFLYLGVLPLEGWSEGGNPPELSRSL